MPTDLSDAQLKLLKAEGAIANAIDCLNEFAAMCPQLHADLNWSDSSSEASDCATLVGAAKTKLMAAYNKLAKAHRKYDDGRVNIGGVVALGGGDKGGGGGDGGGGTGGN